MVGALAQFDAVSAAEVLVGAGLAEDPAAWRAVPAGAAAEVLRASSLGSRPSVLVAALRAGQIGAIAEAGAKAAMKKALEEAPDDAIACVARAPERAGLYGLASPHGRLRLIAAGADIDAAERLKILEKTRAVSDRPWLRVAVDAPVQSDEALPRQVGGAAKRRWAGAR